MHGLAGSIKDFPHLLSQAFANLTPGGWVECNEFEAWLRNQADDKEGAVQHNEIFDAPMIQKWQSGLSEAADKIGRSFDISANLKKRTEEAGFVNVTEVVKKVPCSPWPKHRTQKEIGAYQQNMLDRTTSYRTAHFTRVLGWSHEEYQVLAAGWRNEFKDKKLHLYSNFYFVHGQKPLDAAKE